MICIDLFRSGTVYLKQTIHLVGQQLGCCGSDAVTHEKKLSAYA